MTQTTAREQPPVDLILEYLPNGKVRATLQMGPEALAYADLTAKQAAQWGATLTQAAKAMK